MIDRDDLDRALALDEPPPFDATALRVDRFGAIDPFDMTFLRQYGEARVRKTSG